MDEWAGMNVGMIRDIEDEVQVILDEKIKSAGPLEIPPAPLSEISHVSK